MSTTLYIPVPRGATLAAATLAPRRPGRIGRMWGALRRRPTVPAYDSYAACAQAHPGCDVWRLPIGATSEGE